MPTTGIVRVAVVQCSSVILDVGKTVTKLEKYAKEAAENGAKLVVFPEAFISCYPRGTNFGVIIGSRSPVHTNFTSILRFLTCFLSINRKVGKSFANTGNLL